MPVRRGDAATVGKQFVHVVFIAWQGTTPPDPNVVGPRVLAEIRNIWTPASYGRITFEGRWYPVYVVPKPTGANAASNTAIVGYAEPLVRAQAIARGETWPIEWSADQTQWIAYQFPPIGNSFAMWRAWASSNGAANGHEAGHVIGFSHAQAMSYDATNPTNPRQVIEYGGPNDRMGAGGDVTNVGNKRSAGWVDNPDGSEPRTLTVTTSGTYVIGRSDLPLPVAGPVALRIATSPKVNVEYRGARSPSRVGSVYVTTGDFGRWIAEDLDFGPGRDYTVDEGQAYQNATLGVRVDVRSISLESAVIAVTMGVPGVAAPQPAGVGQVEKIQ